MAITLYYAPIACSLVPYVNLTEAGAEFEVRTINLRGGQQMSPEYMKLNPKADLFIPDQQTGPGAFARTTHLGIGAHQDDLEFMAYEGILACYDKPDRWFGGVIMTDGRSSSRKGPYAGWSDDQIAAVQAQLDSDTLTENTRAAYRLSFINNALIPSIAASRTNSCRTPSGITINPSPPDLSRVSRTISSC